MPTTIEHYCKNMEEAQALVKKIQSEGNEAYITVIQPPPPQPVNQFYMPYVNGSYSPIMGSPMIYYKSTAPTQNTELISSYLPRSNSGGFGNIGYQF